jgi:hypothetical protein
MQLYVQSDQESKLEAQGKFLGTALGRQVSFAHRERIKGDHSVKKCGLNRGLEKTDEIV